MSILRATLLALSLLSLGIVVSGCKSGGDPPPAPTVATAGATERSTDIQEVGAVIDAVFSRDRRTVAPLISFSAIPCKAPPRLLGGPPECGAGESDGTPVEVLPAMQCESFYIGADGIDLALLLNKFLASDPTLFAIYHAPPAYRPAGEYVAVLSVNDPNLGHIGRALVIAGGRLVGVDYGCAKTPQQMIESAKLTDAVLAPAGPTPTP